MTSEDANYWTKRLSRRGFLRGAAAGTAGVATLAAFGCGGKVAAPAGGSASPGLAFPSRTLDGNGSGGTLVIAMTATNLPIPDSQVTEGGEGTRFVGVQLYQGLTRYDLTQNDTLPTPGPGLAKSWDPPAAGSNVWTFHLRPGVTFHDGEPWNADAAMFAFERVLNPNFQYYSKQMAASSAQNLRFVKAYQKTDDMTIQLETKEPYSFLPWVLTAFNFPSPAAVKQWGDKYFEHPIGTGPFRFVNMQVGQSMELAPFDKYWLGKPKLDRIILRPVPQDTTRLAELKTGGVNWSEVPPHDSVNDLKASGYQVLTGTYPHQWPYVLNCANPPFNNKLARHALNYAVDRVSMASKLLNNLAEPTGALVYPTHPWFGNPTPYSYDPKKAKELLAQAGYPNGLTMTIKAPSSGSGNMWPIEMNQYVQKNLADVGITLKVQTVEWQSLLTEWTSDRTKGFGPDVAGFCYSLGPSTPDSFSVYFAGNGGPNVNQSQFDDPKLDDLLQQARAAYDPGQQAELLKQVHGLIVEDAPWLFIVHDLNARVMSSKVRGIIDPQSWSIDLTHAWVAS